MKPALTLAQQVALLKARGLLIPDDTVAERFLYDSNYYRVSGYARQFQCDPRSNDDRFVDCTSLDDLRRVFLLDVELSSALSRCLGVVERTVRSRLAHELALAAGHHAFYLEPTCYLTVTPGLDALLERIREELQRAKSPTVLRYAQGEDLTSVPVWAAFELLTFGTISKILEYFADREPRDRVAASFSEQKATFPSTIHSLAVLRNRCAHHGQVWHRHLTIQTPDVKKQRRHEPAYDPQGTYPAILAMRRNLKTIGGCQDKIDCVDEVLERDAVFREGILTPCPR